MSSVIYVGMDVHQDSFSLCALDALNGEIIRETKCTADIQNVVKFTSHLPQTDGTQIVLGYEAGNDVYPQSWKSTLGVFFMTKISVNTKIKAVEEYANGNARECQ